MQSKPESHLAKTTIFEPFAKSIFYKARYLKDNLLLKFEQKLMKETISDDIKKVTNFTQRRFSVKAKQEADRLGINLSEMDWYNQPKFDPRRKVFHYEHVVPVVVLRDRCIEAEDFFKIEEILRHDAQVAWILKEEDRKLNELGYRHKRPDPRQAYRDAGIELVEI